MFAPVSDLFNPKLGSALIWISVIFPGAVLVTLYSLATVPAYLAVTVRRFHDVGLSGKWLLAMYMVQQVVAFLPVIFIFSGNDPEEADWLWRVSPVVSLLCLIIIAVIASKDSQVEPNKWGENPKFFPEV